MFNFSTLLLLLLLEQPELEVMIFLMTAYNYVFRILNNELHLRNVPVNLMKGMRLIKKKYKAHSYGKIKQKIITCIILRSKHNVHINKFR